MTKVFTRYGQVVPRPPHTPPPPALAWTNKGNPYTQTSSEHQQYERSNQYFSPKLSSSVEMLIDENYLVGLRDTEV